MMNSSEVMSLIELKKAFMKSLVTLLSRFNNCMRSLYRKYGLCVFSTFSSYIISLNPYPLASLKIFLVTCLRLIFLIKLFIIIAMKFS